MIQEDYFIKMIKDCVKLFSKLVFNKEVDDVQEQLTIEQQDDINKYLNLVKEGNISEVKRLLKELGRSNQFNALKVGLVFFTKINDFSDQELSEYRYSREELRSDLNDFMNMYGYGEITKIYFGEM